MSYFDTSRQTLKLFPRKHLGLLVAMIFAVTLVFFATQKTPEQSRLTISVDLLTASPTETGEVSSVDELEFVEPVAQLRWEVESVRSGDNLSNIFNRVGVSYATLLKLMQSDSRAATLKRIYPKQEFRFAFDQEDQLVAIEYHPTQLEQFVFSLNEQGQFETEHIITQPDIQIKYLSATLDDSLFLSGQKAGMPQNLIMQLADVFSGVIDFVYEPRKGDTFDVLFEEKYVNGEKIGYGNLLAASYHASSKTHTAYRYLAADGSASFYDENGQSLRKAFLRAPLDFTRISSNFNPGRLHPVLKTMRAHRGTDYAAPTGTPVFAAGDGRVSESGFNQANGNYVFIAHGTAYVTKYLHLSKRYVKTGQTVKQRTVIGAVGATGYATGPHLHYEFLVNGVHRDPRTILDKLPSATPIAKSELDRFNEQVLAIKTQYSHQQQLFASAE